VLCLFHEASILSFLTFWCRYALSGDVALQKIETLSGGQKSRVVFAHIAMIQPQIMVLDEPVNHLVRYFTLAILRPLVALRLWFPLLRILKQSMPSLRR
jgi:ABC-type phosphate/phosphonate transport system ATPase subunit